MDWLRSARLCLITAVLLAATACAATVPPAAGKGGAASAVRTASAPRVTPSGKGGSPSPVAGIVDPSVQCFAKPTGGPMVLVGHAIYEVGDPVHPRLLCRVANTRAHLFTGDTFEYVRRSGESGTEVVLHSMGSGNESVVAGWPIKLLDDRGGVTGDWTPDGNTAASLVPAIDGAGRNVLQVWLFSQGATTILYQLLTPKEPQRSAPTLAFSADGQYLVTGWPASPSGYPLFVFRVGVHDPVQTLDPADTTALWSRSGHVLYLSPGPNQQPRAWAPESGFSPLAGSAAWQFPPSLSPDGSTLVFADGKGALDEYDLRSQTSRTMQIQSTTSQVTFVKNDWVWYSAGSTIVAMDLATHDRLAVVFGPGEAPSDLAPAEFWPNS